MGVLTITWQLGPPHIFKYAANVGLNMSAHVKHMSA